jgi:hypothetical protein
VLKVVNCSLAVKTGLGKMGLVHLGRHTIRVLDLHQYLTVETGNLSQRRTHRSREEENPLGELWGVPPLVRVASPTGEATGVTSLQNGVPQESANQPFLLIIRDQQGELCGFSVDEPPDLVEIPHQIMRSLPKSERQTKGVLEIVSHAFVVSQEDVTTTIFLLDVKRVLNSVSYPALPSAEGRASSFSMRMP